MTDNLLNTEYQQNPPTRSGASEAYVPVYTHTVQEQFLPKFRATFYQTTRRHIPKYNTFHSYHREGFKTCQLKCCFKKINKNKYTSGFEPRTYQ
jgi:hypothetical protein